MQVPGTGSENVFLSFCFFFHSNKHLHPNLSDEHINRLLIFSSCIVILKHTFNLSISVVAAVASLIFILPPIKYTFKIKACKRDSVNKTSLTKLRESL